MFRNILILLSTFMVLNSVNSQHISCPTIHCPSISCPTISCPVNSGLGSTSVASTPPIQIPAITIPSTNPSCAPVYCPSITCSPVSCSGNAQVYNPTGSQVFPGQTYPTVGGPFNPVPYPSGTFGTSGPSNSYPAPQFTGSEYNFTGHYQSASNETTNMDDFLNALGLSFLNRPKITAAAQELFITKDKAAPNSYQVKNSLTAVGDTFYIFRDGTEFNENRLYDRKNVRTIVQVRGNQWIQTQYGEPEVSVLYEFGVPSYKDLRVTTRVNGVTTVRKFIKKN